MTVDTRLQLGEYDHDDHDRKFELLLTRQDANNRILMGLLISFSLAALGLAGNLIAGAI